MSDKTMSDKMIHNPLINATRKVAEQQRQIQEMTLNTPAKIDRAGDKALDKIIDKSPVAKTVIRFIFGD